MRQMNVRNKAEWNIRLSADLRNRMIDLKKDIGSLYRYFGKPQWKWLDLQLIVANIKHHGQYIQAHRRKL